MKKIFLSVACAALIMTACNNKTEEAKTEETATETTTEQTTPPAAESTDGGSVEVNKEGVSIEGKDGGSLEVNKDGLKIEGKDEK